MNSELEPTSRWYEGISRYQWLVLVIACLGWTFDVFEGQLFVATMNEAIPDLVPEGTSRERIELYNNIALAMFLVGGAAGGLLFGVLSDVHGHRVLHRNVKPGNIIVNDAGPIQRATLIDVGLIQSAHTDTVCCDEAARAAMYMSPEQAGLIDADDFDSAVKLLVEVTKRLDRDTVAGFTKYEA